MWYCTVCGKRNISDEINRVCDQCDGFNKELVGKGGKKPSLYCHSCGHQNKSETSECERCSYNALQTGNVIIERANVRLFVNKLDALQTGIDKIQGVSYEGKGSIPDKNTERIGARSATRDIDSGKGLSQVKPASDEVKLKPDRGPCPECNPEGNGAHKGKCKYCGGEGWWPCTRCGGEGILKGSVLGVFTDKLPKCPKCHGGKWFGCGLCNIPASDTGDGKVNHGDGLCRRCHGTGFL